MQYECKKCSVIFEKEYRPFANVQCPQCEGDDFKILTGRKKGLLTSILSTIGWFGGAFVNNYLIYPILKKFVIDPPWNPIGLMMFRACYAFFSLVFVIGIFGSIPHYLHHIFKHR